MKHSVVLFRSAVKAFLLIGFMALSLGASAQVKLSVQGLLKKGDGTSQPDGNVNMKFNFYKASDNSFVASITATNVPVSGGVYSALLDVSTSNPSNALTFSTEYVVGLQVDGGTEMTPRINLTAAPYALALNGVSNVFPTLGTVKVDAIDVAGAAKVVGTTNTGNLFVNGFAHSSEGFYWHNNGTGQVSGMGVGNNNVALYANGTKVLESNNTLMTIPTTLQVSGNESVTGTFSAGSVFSESSVIAKGKSNNGGFTFQDDPGYDTGLFSNGSGECQLRTNGTSRIWLGNNLDISNNANVYVNASGDVQLAGSGNGSNNSIVVGGAIIMNLGAANGGAGYLYINGMKPKGNTGNPRNLAIDMSNGRVFEESSSRRYKKNIRPLQDNFDLLLKVEPRIYNRFEDPADIDTSKYFEIGYIAEEIDSIGLRKLVQYSNEGQIDGVDYTKMILYTVELLKTQHADIEKLKAEVAALTAEKNALRTENASLRADAQNQQADFGKQLNELSRRLKSLETAASNR